MTVIESLEAQRASRRFISISMRAPLLSREDELVLARRWREHGDIVALHGLIDAYSRLVVRPAMHYRRYGASLSELVQEGVVGLMMAAQRFQPEREIRFSTYAAWWVRAAMQDYILRNWSVVRVGTTAAQKTLFFNFRRLRAAIDEPYGGSLTVPARQAIADALKVSLRDDVVTLKALSRKLGISKERVRQIEHGAMRKIKRSIIRQSGMKSSRLLFDA